MKKLLFFVFAATNFLYAQPIFETYVEIPDRDHWGQSIELLSDGTVILLGIENRYNSIRYGVTFGSGSIGLAVSKINNSGDQLWQIRYPDNPGFSSLEDRRRSPFYSFHVDEEDNWIIPYRAFVGRYFCDSTERSIGHTEFIGMMIGDRDGNVHTDSVHSMPYCENYEIKGFAPNPDGNGITIVSHDKNTRFTQLDTFNQILYQKEFIYEKNKWLEVAGAFPSGFLLISYPNYDVKMFLTNLKGDIFWQRPFQNPLGYLGVTDIIQGENKTFYISIREGVNTHHSAIMQIDSLGEIIQSHIYNNWKIKKLISLGNGELLVLYQLTHPQPNEQYIGVSRLNAEGEVLSTATYGHLDYPVDIEWDNQTQLFTVLGTHNEGWLTGTPTKKAYLIRNHISQLNNPLDIPLTLFPNPAQEQIHLTGLPAIGTYEIEIFDLLGRLVQRETYYLQQPISVEKLAVGMYFLRAKSAADNSYEKTVRFQIMK